MNRKILVSIACYKNVTEVISFVEQLAKQTISSNIIIGIFCDSKEFLLLNNGIEKLNITYYLVDKYYNMGYLNNCINVIKEYKNDYDWAIISNTDIVYYSNDYYEKIFDLKIDSSVWEIGTKIINNKEKRQTNPLIVNKPSKKYMKIKKIVFTNKILFYLYSLIYQLKKNIIKEEAKVNTGNVYAVHGSHFILRKECVDELGKISNNIFMYGEEELIAGLVDKNNKKVLYVDELSIEHKSNSTTNGISSLAKFNMYKKSYSYIYDLYFK